VIRDLPVSLVLVSALIVSACAGPTPVERHWGEAQRGASEAMVEAARGEPGRGLDGAGATAAHDNYVESLEPPPEDDSRMLLDVVEID
jgi:hypothetical protein